MTTIRSLAVVAAGFGAGAFTFRAADPAAWTPTGHSFELAVEVPVEPAVAWDRFTGDVAPWWDHHLVDQPRSLTIGRTTGSSFVEIVDEAGHGAEHARVTHAIRGELLRLVGPLGRVGHGIDIEGKGVRVG